MSINDEIMDYLGFISLIILMVEVVLGLIFCSTCMIIAIIKCHRGESILWNSDINNDEFRTNKSKNNELRSSELRTNDFINNEYRTEQNPNNFLPTNPYSNIPQNFQ